MYLNFPVKLILIRARIISLNVYSVAMFTHNSVLVN